MKKYCLDNRDWIKHNYLDNRDRIKEYQLKSHDKINTRKKIYSNNTYKTDINFRLTCETRSRIRQVLRGKVKSSSRVDILGIDLDTYRRRIEYQFTLEMNWSDIKIDHNKRICLFDVSEDEELREFFDWKNTQPILKDVHQQKGVKFNLLGYTLQFIRAYQFSKPNEERLN